MHETRTNKILRQIKEIAEIAGIRTEQYARVTKKRLDVLGLSRELTREKGALGDRVYELSRAAEPGSILEDVTVQAILGRIANLERTLGEYEEEINDIHESSSERASDVKRKYQPPAGNSWEESVPAQKALQTSADAAAVEPDATAEPDPKARVDASAEPDGGAEPGAAGQAEEEPDRRD